jgi:hypothetical protein
MPRSQPGPHYESCQLLAEAGSVLGIQVYLVIPAIHAEHKGFVGRTAGQIVLELYFDFLHLFPPNIMRQPESFPPGSALTRNMIGFSIVGMTVSGLLGPSLNATTSAVTPASILQQGGYRAVRRRPDRDGL